MSGDLLVRFDEGEWVARKCRPLSYSTYLKAFQRPSFILIVVELIVLLGGPWHPHL